MLDKIKVIYIQIILIPLFLRIITITFIFFGLFGIISIVLQFEATYSVNGTVMNYIELWNSGYIYLFLFFDIFILVIGLGFFYAKNWSRYFVLIYFLLSPLYILFNAKEDFYIGNILSLYIIALIPIWYLFKKKSVVKYFENN